MRIHFSVVTDNAIKNLREKERNTYSRNKNLPSQPFMMGVFGMGSSRDLTWSKVSSESCFGYGLAELAVRICNIGDNAPIGVFKKV